MSQAGPWPSGLSHAYWPDARRLASTLHSAAPALLFGLRLWEYATASRRSPQVVAVTLTLG